MAFIYKEHKLDRPLSDAIVSFWSFTFAVPDDAPLPPLPYRVLPDGCADLIARYTHPSCPDDPGTCCLFVSGPLSRFKMVAIAPRTTLWGMQIRAGWMEAILGISPCRLPAGLGLAERYTPRLAPLARRFSQAASPQLVETMFRDGVTCLASDAQKAVAPAPAAHLLEALRLLEADGGRIRMATLAKNVGTSERTLHRQLTDRLGMSPKRFARILRFQNATARLREATVSLDLAGFAVEAGYFDQAHMTHEFRALSGLTPITLPLSPLAFATSPD